MLVGAHVSVSQGYASALAYARSVGCECLQMFAKSPRQWRAAPIDRQAAAGFVETREELGFGPVFTHTAYLINLSTTDDELRRKSIVALADELVRGSLLAASGVVTHLGNDPGDDPLSAARRAGEAIAEAFDIAGPHAQGTRLLLENTAGAGRTFGSTFEQLAGVIVAAGLPEHQVGVCFDTCHGFAFGMPVDTADGWARLVDGIEATVGVERLALVHANDCLFEQGSRKDRHAWIGEGLMGEQGFAAMLCDMRIAHACAITEMPGEVPQKDAVNVGRLLALRERCQASQ